MERIKQKVRDIDLAEAKSPAVNANILENHGLKNITLRDYQVLGVDWLVQRFCRGHGSILGDEMGLGKTCQTISLLVFLKGSKKASGPFLILSPLSVLANWQNELARFAPDMDVTVYTGSKDVREAQRIKVRKNKQNLCVLLTTYEICLKDESFLRRFSWSALVVDEAHRLKNRQSLLHQALLDFNIDHHLLLTGTPIQNNLRELYALLCFIGPKIFKEKYTDDFVEHYSEIEEKKDATELHKLLKPFLLRRVKSEVVKDLPQKSEVVLYHGMSTVQKKYYRAILTKDLSLFETQHPGSRTKLMNILMQLRKCVNHPYLFDGVEPEPFELGEHLVEASGKLLLIDQLLSYLLPRKHKVLLFSQMTRMLDVIQDYLGYRGYNYERLDGSVRGEERYLAVKNFNDDSDTFVFLLSTKAGGQGLNLVSADTVIFVDSDFNPQNDLQAAARAHRIGQTRPVKIIRLLGRSTVEEIILRRAEAKLKLTNTVIEGGQFSHQAGTSAGAGNQLLDDADIQLSDILKFGVDRLLANEDSSIEDVDFESILGQTTDGKWVEEKKDEVQAKASLAVASMEIDEEDEDGAGEVPGGSSMYVFEGTDYSKEPTKEDMDFFESMLETEKALKETSIKEGRMKRGKNWLVEGLPDPERKTRKPMSKEEMEERRKKRDELAKKRAKEAEVAALKKALQKKKKLEALWETNNYNSLSIKLDEDSNTDDDDDDDDDDNNDDDNDGDNNNTDDITDENDDNSSSRTLNYLVGDVTQPQHSVDEDAIILHCVDDSGSWGSGGVFTALSKRSTQPEEHYELAASMKDINLADAHLIPLEDKPAKNKSKEYCMLLVAQHRDRRNNLSGIQLTALQDGLKKVYKTAKQHAASVHLARIGHNTPNFNWYGTERLLRKELAAKGIPTYIYYYKRRAPLPPPQRRRRSSSSCDSSPAPKVRRLSTEDHPSTSVTTGPTHCSQKDDSESSDILFPLPDFMKGTSVYLHEELDEEYQRKLKRYLIAFDGDICDALSCDTTTHVIVPEDLEDTEEVISFAKKRPTVPIVSGGWLESCYSHMKFVNTEKYRQDQ